ncbi:hypothetical protein AOLI_G00254370 [Acnodon oligacanthus]
MSYSDDIVVILLHLLALTHACTLTTLSSGENTPHLILLIRTRLGSVIGSVGSFAAVPDKMSFSRCSDECRECCTVWLLAVRLIYPDLLVCGLVVPRLRLKMRRGRLPRCNTRGQYRRFGLPTLIVPNGEDEECPSSGHPPPSRRLLQSTYYGLSVSKALLDSQFSYQPALDESTVLIYGKDSFL